MVPGADGWCTANCSLINGCAKCAMSGTNVVCTEAKPGYLLINSTYAQLQCTDGRSYLKNLFDQTCTACDANCLTCSSTGNCLTCNNQVAPIPAANQVKVPSGQTCVVEPCSANCASCIFNSSSLAKEC